jgi:arylsulfatase A-like enzyme
MTGTRKPNPSRRAFLGASGTLLGANLVSTASAPPALAALAQQSPPAQAPATPPSGYNILFVFVDQEHFFDKWPFPVPGREYLKANGIAFANHQSASQVCSPARSTVYTGLHIQHTGVFDNMEAPWQPDMSTGVVTIGHRLQQIGYHAAYQGKWHLSSKVDVAKQPIDSSLHRNNNVIDSYGFSDFLGFGDLIDGPHGGYAYDDFSTTSAISWLRTRAQELKAQNRQWFMAVNLVNPHDVMFVNADLPGQTVQGMGPPYFPIKRPPLNEVYRAEWDAPLPATRHQPLDAPGRPAAHLQYQLTQDIMLGQWPDEDRRWRVLQNYYFNCIRDCDNRVVQLLETLKANGLDRSTIVVFTSDHGELCGAHQMRGKGSTVYKEQNHVPLIIMHPAYPGGMSTQAVSSQIDLAPTLLALTGQPADAVTRAGVGLKGRDLTPILSAPSQASPTAVRPAALFNYNMFSYLDAQWFSRMTQIGKAHELYAEKIVKAVTTPPDFRKRGAIRSVFDGRYKFARYFSPLNFNRPTTYEALLADNDLEVYDLKEDPDETYNMAQDLKANAQLIMALNAVLNERIEDEVGVDDGRFLPLFHGFWRPKML